MISSQQQDGYQLTFIVPIGNIWPVMTNRIIIGLLQPMLNI